MLSNVFRVVDKASSDIHVVIVCVPQMASRLLGVDIVAVDVGVEFFDFARANHITYLQVNAAVVCFL